MPGLLDALKKTYFGLEDKYYEFLDKIQTKIPVYSVVDPVDKVLPSFAILLGVFVLLVLGLIVLPVLGGLGGGTVQLGLTFNDEQGSPLSDVGVSVSFGEKTLSGVTDASGKIKFDVKPGLVAIEAVKEGYESFTHELKVAQTQSQIFMLRLALPEVKTRVLLIQDELNNILGTLAPLSISLSFACQAGTPPPSQTVTNGSVSVQQSADCLGLSVTVSAHGYVTKTQPVLGDTTVIILQTGATFDPPDTDPEMGNVEVYVKDTQNTPISTVQVKLYKVPSAGSNILTNQSLSDTQGFSLFQDVTPGKYVVIASKSGYKQTTSSQFQVDAGQTKTITLSLSLSSTNRKVFIKVVSSTNQLPVSGAIVSLHAQLASGNYIEYDTFTTDTNGIVDQPLADFNGNTTLVVQHSNYVTRILPNTGVVSDDVTTPTAVLMDPLQSANANGSIPNAVIADVKTMDPLNLPIPNAQARLYTPDLNGVLLGTIPTNTSGIARFSNLPAGSYQAAASNSLADGNSPKVNGNVGQIISLPVVMDVGNALVEVTVKNEQNSVVVDANVFIVNNSTQQIVAQGKTNSQGVVQLGVLTGQRVFVRVLKTGYLPFNSVPFDVIKDNTHHIRIEVGLTSATQPVDMTLIRIDELSSTSGPVPAQTLVPGNSYAFHFSVKTTSQQTQFKAMARVNNDSPPQQQSNDVGAILDGQVAIGGIGFYTTYNPLDEFSPSGPVSSNTPAKVSINALGDVNGAGSWEYIVVIKVNPQAVPNVDKLVVRFQSKSNAQVSPLYVESYTIGQSLPTQGDFGYLFFLNQVGSTQQVQVTSSNPVVVEQNKDYTLTYAITNASGANFSTATLSFTTTTPSSFSVVPSQANLPGFNNGSTVGGSVNIRSASTCSGGVPYCSSLTALLNNVGTGNTPTSYTLNFFTIPERQLLLATTPAYLLPGLQQTIQAVATDNQGNPLTPSQGLQIQGQLQDGTGQNSGNPINFTGNPFGVYLAAVPPANNGDKFVVTATASGYLSDVKTIPVSNNFTLNFSQDFSCLTLTPNPLSFQKGAVGLLNVQTQSCPENLTLYTAGFSENGNLIQLTVREGTNTITPSNPVSLNASDSTTLTVLSPPYIGQYPLYVYAKYASENQYSLVTNVDVTVNPLAGSTQCLNIQKYAFDLTDGSDATTIVNNCNPNVHDPFSPNGQLPVNGVYAHVAQPLLTPEMLFPGTPVSFNYTIKVDYNHSTRPDLNHTDFTRAPAIPDGKWYRYQIPSFGTNPGPYSRDSFLGAQPMLVNDSTFLGVDFYLESWNQQATFPYYDSTSKALLFETTFIVAKPVTLDKICIATGGINHINVRIDGKLVQSTLVTDCGSGSSTSYGNIPTTMRSVHFSPGPHSIQIFLNHNNTNNFWLIARYTRNNTAAKLSNGHGLGFWLSPLHGIPFSNDTKTNGVYAYGPFSGVITPAGASQAPKYLSSLASEVKDILTNNSGIEHLKQAYVQAISDNPAVRVFVKDNDVYAQYVGFDNPNGTQNLLVENLGMLGEKYGVLSLKDYTIPTAGTPTVDLGVLVDASSSWGTQEADNVIPRPGQTIPYKQNGLCQVIANLEKSMEYFSNAQVNLKVFLLNTPSEYTNVPSQVLPCSSFSPVILSSNTNPPSYDALVDDKNESWAWGSQVVAANNFWQSTNRVLVILTDNKPYGLGPQSFVNGWKGSAEETLVNSAAVALNNKNIKGVVLYLTPIESTSIAAYGDVFKNDAMELMEHLAVQTDGFVEALDFSEFVPTGALASSHAFDLSSSNKVGQRLAQTAFDIQQENIVVKLKANQPNACISEDGLVGNTGQTALPKILLNWTWASVSQDLCDQKAPPNQDIFRYCDATQFSIGLIKKMRLLELAYAPDANASQVAQIPFLTNFDAFLVRDSFNNDFRVDFKDFYVNSSFADAPAYFKNNVTGAWKDYVDPNSQRLDFTITGQPAGTTTLPYSGLYRVQITVNWQAGVGTFFVASSPSATIHVKLTPLANAQNLQGYSSFYEIPLDGLVGVDTSNLTLHRQGYGTGFTGQVVDLVPTPGFTLRSYPSQVGNVALNMLNISTTSSFVSLNTSERGVLTKLDLANGQLVLRPSLPAPVVVEWTTNSSGQGDVYYGIQETDSVGLTGFVSYTNPGNAPLAKWTPVASLVKQPTYGCTSSSCAICLDGGGHLYNQAVVPDFNPTSNSCGLRAPLTSDKAFGFTSTSGFSNNAYLASVLYRVPPNNYSIMLGCNNSPTHHIGSILTGNGVLSNSSGSSVSVLDTGNTTLESQFAPAQSLFGMLDLIGTDWTCISTQSGKTNVYWNAPKLRDFLIIQNPSFGSMSGNACVATGNPLNPVSFWSLKEEVRPLNLSTSNSSSLCSLYTWNSNNGHYNQFGLPYPVGTIINVGNAVGPTTGDPLHALTQYRYAPTGCSINNTYPSCSIGNNNFCQANTQRIWQGIPNIQP